MPAGRPQVTIHEDDDPWDTSEVTAQDFTAANLSQLSLSSQASGSSKSSSTIKATPLKPVRTASSSIWDYFSGGSRRQSSGEQSPGPTPIASASNSNHAKKASLSYQSARPPQLKPLPPNDPHNESWVHVPTTSPGATHRTGTRDRADSLAESEPDDTLDHIVPLKDRVPSPLAASSSKPLVGLGLSTEQMAAAVKLNVEEITRDPALPLQHLRVSDSGNFYDAGPSFPPFSLAPAPRSPGSQTPSLAPFASPPLQPFSQSFQSFSQAKTSHPPPEEPTSKNTEPESIAEQECKRTRRKKEKFLDCLCRENVDLGNLRKLSWAGIPDELRPICWQLLLGYLPAPSARRISVLARKRQEYADAVRLAFAKGREGLNQTIWHQIHIDVPRTNSGVQLWAYEATQKSLERILYVWAIRHPASGYVQGINDLVTPFFQVFLSAYIDIDPETFDVAHLPTSVLQAVEADSFWCLSKLTEGIQDNYTPGQPGIQRQINKLREHCERVDAPLAQHLAEQNVEFIQFAFKWIHLLLLRVLPVDAVIRMWDSYMSEGSNAFSEYHTYVCLAFLLRSSVAIRQMDFQAMMFFFQAPVEHDAWSPQETEVLLSEGFLWKSIFSPHG